GASLENVFERGSLLCANADGREPENQSGGDGPAGRRHGAASSSCGGRSGLEKHRSAPPDPGPPTPAPRTEKRMRDTATPGPAAGLARALLLQQLPAPFATPWYRKATRVVAMPDGHTLTVPAGFTVNVFADKLQFARFMALAANGDVLLAEPVRGGGRITILRDADHDGVAEVRETFATGLNRPFGLALWKNYLYVGNNDSVVRFAYKPGQIAAEGPPEKIADLPPSDAALDQDTANRLKIDISQTRGYNHWTRNVIFNRAGTKLYVTVGSATNATPETDARRAAINEYNPDGSGH